MSDRLWVAPLLIPAPLYVGLRFLLGFSGYGAELPIGFALALVFGLATGTGLLQSPVLVWGGRVALLLAVVVPILPTFPAGAGGLDLAAGVMLGLPFLGLEGAWRSASSPGSRLGTVELTLFLGVLYLATVPVISAGGGPLTGLGFFQAISSVIGAQIQGLIATFTGGAATAALPLATSLDPIFIGLGGLAFLAVMLTSLSPRTALDEPLPWSWSPRPRGRTTSGRAVGPEVLRTGQRDALDTRTLAMTPEAVLPPGFGSLMIAALAIVLVVLGAIYLPIYILFGVALLAVGLIVTVIVLLSRRLAPSRVAPVPAQVATAAPEVPPAGSD